MINSPLLDVAISMVFIFFIFSILTSAITEMITTALALRGKDLRWAIEEIFNDPNNKNWSELMYDHPLIDGLKKTDDSLPSYISSDVFAMALIDVFIEESKTIKVVSTGDNIVFNEEYPSMVYERDHPPLEDGSRYAMPNDERSLYNFKEGVKKINPGDVQQLLKNFIYKSKTYDELINNVKAWYNEYMDRASGWYKKKLRNYLLVVGLLVAMVANVDSIKLTNVIYKNKDLREMIVSQAETYVKENKNEAFIKHQIDSMVKASRDSDSTAVAAYAKQTAIQKQFTDQLGYVKSVYDTIEGMNLPIGWHSYDDLYEKKIFKNKAVKNPLKGWCNFKLWLKQTYTVAHYNIARISVMGIIGWIITGYALSMGAPFWFDLLNKLVNMRNSGKKPGEK